MWIYWKKIVWVKFKAKSTQPSCGTISADIDMTKFMETTPFRIRPMAALPKPFTRRTPGGPRESAQDSHKRDVSGSQMWERAKGLHYMHSYVYKLPDIKNTPTTLNPKRFHGRVSQEQHVSGHKDKLQARQWRAVKRICSPLVSVLFPPAMCIFHHISMTALRFKLKHFRVWLPEKLKHFHVWGHSQNFFTVTV